MDTVCRGMRERTPGFSIRAIIRFEVDRRLKLPLSSKKAPPAKTMR
ncbi:hypothetical protein PAESOLCIP111_00255 [Paenibacillus solanacearum]|uniref:Uncharacterized protein n=1 Tax=Paenibacillus solanacearum TaxID=2048548 RepID=A0A916NLD6_9BACL|nr:hypothetical protein PAESOLCIP111_00255 [Paenibacillus solanacearum]